jgi:uncharacterized protein (TIGR02265 family)
VNSQELYRLKTIDAEEPTGAPNSWGSRAITLAQAQEFAARVTSVPSDQATIAKNLAAMSPEIQVRGVFLEGLTRVVQQARSDTAALQLQRKAGIPEHAIPFRHYAHRDFYKLYYLTARLLHPSEKLAASLRITSRTFFPIFRNSLLGKTMGALMGEKPGTILPLLSRAYNLSVAGNEHTSEFVGEREIAWKCRVEPVEWYEQTFSGIIEGTAPDGEASPRVRMLSKALRGGAAEYQFQITW